MAYTGRRDTPDQLDRIVEERHAISKALASIRAQRTGRSLPRISVISMQNRKVKYGSKRADTLSSYTKEIQDLVVNMAYINQNAPNRSAFQPSPSSPH